MKKKKKALKCTQSEKVKSSSLKHIYIKYFYAKLNELCAITRSVSDDGSMCHQLKFKFISATFHVT